MTQYISVAKAARLVGLKRRELQQRILDGELCTFEGMLDTRELKRVFPKAVLVDDSQLERVQDIKAKAVRRKNTRQTLDMTREDLFRQIHNFRDAMLQANENLAQAQQENTRLRRQVQEAQQQAEAYLHLIFELRGKLEAMENDCDQRQKAMLEAMLQWLLNRLEAVAK